MLNYHDHCRRITARRHVTALFRRGTLPGAILIAVLCAPVVNAQQPQSVAVLDYLERDGSGAPPEFGALVAERIRSELRGTGQVVVVAESLLASALAEVGLDVADVTSLGRATTLADTMGAEALVFGSYESYGSVLKITSQIATAGASRLRVVEVAEHMASRTPDQIVEAVASSVIPILVPVERRPTAEPPERDDIVVTQRKRPFKWGGWLSLGVAAGAVAGAVSWHTSSEDEWDAYLNALDPDAIRTHYDDSNRYLTWRNVAFGVGGAALVSALYYFYYKDYGATEEWASVVPMPKLTLQPGRASVALAWRLPGIG